MIYSLLLIAIGLISIYYSVRFLTNPKFAKNYIEKNPKALIWRKIFGIQRAIKISKIIFIPTGILIAIYLIILGIISF